MFAQESVMDIQKIKELALANGFSLKEQASGNMDLHSYVYEFANAIEQAVKAQAVPEWISVGDSLPPVDETVLVCWDYAADIEPEKEYLTLDEDYNEYWPNCQDEPPTHWLPLPKVIELQEPSND